MSEWQETAFSAEARDAIKNAGGVPMAALQRSRDGEVCRVLISRDPSGHNGAIEWHASLSWVPEQTIDQQWLDIRYVARFVELLHISRIASDEGVPVLEERQRGKGGVTHLWFKPRVW